MPSSSAPSRTAADDNCLLLFSSSSRQLYRQNAIDTLAAPVKARRTFRYQHSWLDKDVEALLKSGGLEALRGVSALVCFSLQHPEGMYEAAFVPVRIGTVVDVKSHGPFIFFTIEATSHVAFTSAAGGDVRREDAVAAVRGFQQLLRTDYPGKFPYTAWAASAPGILSNTTAPLEQNGDAAVDLFVRTARYLQMTGVYADTVFLLVRSVRDLGASVQLAAQDDGSFALKGGRTYELTLLHFRPQEKTDPVRFAVEADDEMIKVIGQPHFDAASAYDEIRILFHASDPGSRGSMRTVIRIEPANPEEDSARVTLDVVVEPQRDLPSTSAAVLFAGVTGVVNLVPSLVTLPAWSKGVMIGGLLLILFAYLYFFKIRLAASGR